MPSAVNSKLKAKSDSSGPVVQTEEELLSSLDFSDIERKYAVELPTAFDTVVVVDNLPIIDETKEEKLLNIIKTRVFKNFTINSNNLYLPKDPASGKTKGFMFIDFDTPEIAARAVREGNGHKMDKVHILAVNMFDDIELFTNVDDEFVEPETETFVEKEHLKGWLTDEKARDQFVIMRGNDTGIYWNNKTEPPQLAHKRDGWADMLAWSPLGTYLQTFHKQGAALWGGASFTQIKKFPHVNVKLTDFSPNERYMITWSNEPTIIDGQPYHMIVWDVLTGLQLRPFVLDPSQQLPSTNIGRGNRPATVKFDWPVFKWSHDDKYVAKMVTGPEGLIQIYETPEMGLLDKKSLKVENIKDFSWMPNDHVLAYWTPEGDNIPARITLTKIPSRETLRTKNLVNVIE
ncbi:Translation initiation factor 3 subunit b, partial [Nowakowskiella sp. JEL0078]